VGFLIDTALWIEIERGRLTAGDVHALTRQDPIYLSPVNLAEIRLGIELMTEPRQKRKALTALRRLRRKPILRITGETGELFGQLAARLTKSGRAHGFRVQDLWLAAQAVQRDFTLLTANEKDFRDIPGLRFAVIKLA